PQVWGRPRGHRTRRSRGFVEWRLADRDECVGVGEGWRREQHGIHDRENRRAGAKRQGQREDRGGGARWRTAKHADEMDEVDAHRALLRTPGSSKSFDTI